MNVIDMDPTPAILKEWEMLSGYLDKQGWETDKIQSMRPVFYFCMAVALSTTVKAARDSGGPSSQRFATWLQNVGAEAETACFIAMAARKPTQPVLTRRRHPDWHRVARLTMWASVVLFMALEGVVMARLGYMLLDTAAFCHGVGFKEVQ
jgi:hypothetical protein